MTGNSTYSAILVTYNRASNLLRIVHSILQQNDPPRLLFIINNNSSDRSEQIIKNIPDSRIKYIKSTFNRGHGAALALGLNYYLQNNFTDEYIMFFEDDSIPNAELATSMIHFKKKYSYDLICLEGCTLSVGKRRALIFAEGQEIVSAHSGLFDGAILDARMLHHIGLPVEDWFMMFDDFEYCYRIRKCGFTIGVVRNTFHEILHLGGGERFSRSTLWRSYYQSRNHILFLRMNFNLFNLFDCLLLQGKRLFGSFLAPDRTLRLRLRLIGIYHGLINKKGITLDPATLQFN